MFTATTVPVQVQLAQDILPVSYVNIDSIVCLFHGGMHSTFKLNRKNVSVPFKTLALTTTWVTTLSLNSCSHTFYAYEHLVVCQVYLSS